MTPLINISKALFTRSDMAFRPRRQMNDLNWDSYLGRQNWDHKKDFQSRETTPDFPIACEHIVGTFERALTDSDDWSSADPPGFGGEPFLEPHIIQGIMHFFLERLYRPGNRPETAYGIQDVVGEATKRGILEPRIVLKVYPVLVKQKLFRFDRSAPKDTGAFPILDHVSNPGKPMVVEKLRLAIDVIPYSDFFPDPSPASQWEIYRTRRSLHSLKANSEYDSEAVSRLVANAHEDQERKQTPERRAESNVSSDPYEIEVFEAWGDIVDPADGELLHENVFWTWAGNEILREPTENPFWDGTRPSIVGALFTVPGSIEGKAMADHAVPMWRAQNELVNLHLDGAFRGAWGIGQVRTDIMESPEEIVNGIGPGYVAALKPNVPKDTLFYERVDNGEASQITLDGLNRIGGFMQEAMAMPDTKLGTLPDRQTKATETVQAMQASGSLYESIAARFENTILEPLFEKCWRILLQFVDDFLEEELVQVLGATNTLRLTQLTAVDRFKLLGKTHFKIRGLRGVASKERVFNKLMTLTNLFATNPQLADHFGQHKDFAKLWDAVLQNSGVDPAMMDLDAPPEAPAGTAGGQLNPALPGSSGASAPNTTGIQGPQAEAGAGSGMASNNAVANLNMGA